jgi:hypothetical protein
MRYIFVLFALAVTNMATGAVDTIRLATKVNDVTVFFSGTQVTRKGDLSSGKGKHFLLLEKLPTDINPQSIQVEMIPGCTLHSVKYKIVDPLSGKGGSAEEKLQIQIDTLDLRCQSIRDKLAVYDLEEKLLLDNSILQKKESGVSIAELREAADFYRSRLNEIRQAKLKLKTGLDVLTKNIRDLNARINSKKAESEKPYGQIAIAVECDRELSETFVISYYQPSAGWTPSYDFRVSEINKPLAVVYNANVYQTTGEDWKNVNIRLSTSSPNLSGNRPELKPWYVSRPPVKQDLNPNSNDDNVSSRFEPVAGDQGAIKGKVIDSKTGEPIPFANVVMLLNGIEVGGNTTDFDGNYVIRPLAPGKYNLRVSYVGYQTTVMKGTPIYAGKINFQNVNMVANTVSLQEVEVTEYKVPLISKDQTVSGATISMNDYQSGGVRGQRSSGSLTYVDGVSEKPLVVDKFDYISNSLKTNVANLEYAIDVPYSIPADGIDYSIKIREVSLQVNFVYHAVPKLDNDVFLTAEIPGWNQLNLLTGKAGIYYKGTYTGETGINASEESDTLKVSLGRDKSILVKREGNKKLNDKRVIGNNIKETAAWDITLKNNKETGVHLILEDQFPISDKKSVEVEQLESSGATVDDKTGKLSWDINLDPGAKKVITMKYSVKYPRYSSVVVE